MLFSKSQKTPEPQAPQKITFAPQTAEDLQRAKEEVEKALNGDGKDAVVMGLGCEIERGRDIYGPGVLRAVSRVISYEHEKIYGKLYAEELYNVGNGGSMVGDLALQRHAGERLKSEYPKFESPEEKADWVAISEGRYGDVKSDMGEFISDACFEMTFSDERDNKWVSAVSRMADSDRLDKAVIAMNYKDLTLKDVMLSKQPDPVRSKGPREAEADMPLELSRGGAER